MDVGALIYESQRKSDGRLFEMRGSPISVAQVRQVLRSLTQSIEDLVLVSCDLQRLPKNIGDAKYLSQLDISDNKIDSVPKTTAGLTHLRELVMTQNRLETIPQVLASLSSLESLVADNNLIMSVPDSLAQWASLSVMNLCHNNLNSIPASFAELRGLRQLRMTHNNISVMEATFYGAAAELEVLDLSHNTLRSLKSEVVKWSRLQELSLSHNRIVTLPEELGSMKVLATLDLANNDIALVPENLWRSKSLATLNLGHNHLGTVPETIQHLANLRSLDLSRNRLSSLPDAMAQVSMLHALVLDGNCLTALPEDIGNMKHLKRLSCRCNKLASLPASVAQLTLLRFVCIKRNAIASLDEAVSATLAAVPEVEVDPWLELHRTSAPPPPPPRMQNNAHEAAVSEVRSLLGGALTLEDLTAARDRLLSPGVCAEFMKLGGADALLLCISDVASTQTGVEGVQMALTLLKMGVQVPSGVDRINEHPHCLRYLDDCLGALLARGDPSIIPCMSTLATVLRDLLCVERGDHRSSLELVRSHAKALIQLMSDHFEDLSLHANWLHIFNDALNRIGLLQTRFTERFLFVRLRLPDVLYELGQHISSSEGVDAGMAALLQAEMEDWNLRFSEDQRDMLYLQGGRVPLLHSNSSGMPMDVAAPSVMSSAMAGAEVAVVDAAGATMWVAPYACDQSVSDLYDSVAAAGSTAGHAALLRHGFVLLHKDDAELPREDALAAHGFDGQPQRVLLRLSMWPLVVHMGEDLQYTYEVDPEQNVGEVVKHTMASPGCHLMLGTVEGAADGIATQASVTVLDNAVRVATYADQLVGDGALSIFLVRSPRRLRVEFQSSSETFVVTGSPSPRVLEAEVLRTLAVPSTADYALYAERKVRKSGNASPRHRGAHMSMPPGSILPMMNRAETSRVLSPEPSRLLPRTEVPPPLPSRAQSQQLAAPPLPERHSSDDLPTSEPVVLAQRWAPLRKSDLMHENIVCQVRLRPVKVYVHARGVQHVVLMDTSQDVMEAMTALATALGVESSLMWALYASEAADKPLLMNSSLRAQGIGADASVWLKMRGSEDGPSLPVPHPRAPRTSGSGFVGASSHRLPPRDNAARPPALPPAATATQPPRGEGSAPSKGGSAAAGDSLGDGPPPPPPRAERKDDQDLPLWKDTTDNAIMGSGGLEAASLNNLVLYVMRTGDGDLTTRIAFMFTFRFFTTYDVLLRKFEEVYNVPSGHPQSAARDLIQTRVWNHLYLWVESGLTTMKEEHRKGVSDFIERHFPSPKGIVLEAARQLKTYYFSAVQAEKLGIDVPTDVGKIKPPQPKLPKSMRNITLHDLDSEEVAKQLTLMTFETFVKIEPPEFIGQNWTKDHKKHLSPNVVEMIDQFNRVSAFAAWSVCEPQKLRDRVRVINKLLQIAGALVRMNNFHIGMAIYSGLSNSAVQRLKFTLAKIDKKNKAVMEHMATMFNMEGSYHSYREALAACRPPAIPYLGVVLMDLTFCEDGNPDRIEGLINWTKYAMVHRIISPMFKYQETEYHLAVADVIRKWYLKLDIADEKKVYDMSLKREPRGADRGSIA